MSRPGSRHIVPWRIRRRLIKFAQRQVRRYGYALLPAPKDVTRPPIPDLWDWIQTTVDVRTIIDIGANDGAFATYLAEYFCPDAVHVFEPLAECVQVLETLRERIPNLTIHPMALDEYAGTGSFFRNAYSPASSLLPVGPASQRAFPDAETVAMDTVPLARLDDILPPESLERDILIKIDVQGAEDRVIRGGRAVFSAARYVLVEMSFVPMYEGQPLFEEVHRLLEGCGLRLAGFKNQIDEPRTGQPLFAHCLYHRPGSANGRDDP